jgi:hypothetical protein
MPVAPGTHTPLRRVPTETPSRRADEGKTKRAFALLQVFGNEPDVALVLILAGCSS